MHTVNEAEMQEKVARVFRGCSPRLTRPTITGSWEQLGGEIYRKGDTVIAVIECYKGTAPEGAIKVWSAMAGGFVAVIPPGGDAVHPYAGGRAVTVMGRRTMWALVELARIHGTVNRFVRHQDGLWEAIDRHGRTLWCGSLREVWVVAKGGSL
jgi:hypothetical protein